MGALSFQHTEPQPQGKAPRCRPQNWTSRNGDLRGGEERSQCPEVSTSLHESPVVATAQHHGCGAPIAEVYSLTVLGIPSLKSRCQPGHFSPEAPRRVLPQVLVASSRAAGVRAGVTAASASILP